MKVNIKLIFAIGICMVLTVKASAQSVEASKDGALEHFYFSMDFMAAGGGLANLNNSDYATYNFTAGLGYRFDRNWSVFIPIDVSAGMYNRKSTKNYNEQGTVGAGAAYQFNLNENRQAIEVSLSGASTYIKSDIDFFMSRLMVRYGLNYKNSRPFIGLGCIYLKPYDRNIKSKVMLGISIGVWVF